MFREPDLANVVGSLIEVASGNEIFHGAGQPPIRRSTLPSCCLPIQCLWPKKLGKNSVDAEHMVGIFRTVLKPESLQDAQKAVQQGRNERRGEAYASVR